MIVKYKKSKKKSSVVLSLVSVETVCNKYHERFSVSFDSRSVIDSEQNKHKLN